MAQRVTIDLVDDIDGTEAAETVTFGLDGNKYEIDLSDKNAAKLRKALDNYVGKARRVSGSPARSARKAHTGPDPKAVRAWAKDNGFEVSKQGRVPQEVMDAYSAAN